jgi:membrane protease YdiL (CAAX protease family)
MLLSLSFIVAVSCVCGEGRAESLASVPDAQQASWLWATVIIGAFAAAAIMVSGVWRSTRFAEVRWPFSAVESLLLFLMLQVLGALGAMIGSRMAPPQGDGAAPTLDGALWMIGAASLLQVSALVVVLLRRREGMHPRLHFLVGWTPALTGAIAFAAAWFPLQAIGAAVATVQVGLGGPAIPSEGHATLQLLGESPLDLRQWLMMGCVVLVVPAVEEVMFRGALLGALRRAGLSPWTAIAISASIFALMHIPALVDGAVAPGIAMLLALGMLLGWCATRTGSLAAPITAHALFNAVNLLQSMR